MMFIWSAVFTVYSTKVTGPTDAREKVPQNIMSPPPACVKRAVHWEWNCSHGRLLTLTQPSMWWMNRDSSDQATLFHWFMVQSLCSRAHCTHSWRRRLGHKGTSLRRLLRCHISNSVRWNMCFETIILGPVLNWTVKWDNVWSRFYFTKWINPNGIFLDNTWTSKAMGYSDCFTAMHLLCISTNKVTNNSRVVPFRRYSFRAVVWAITICLLSK